MTREQLIERLNQLTLRYNLTWDDIKYDADRAIDQINNRLGTVFPYLSSVMINENSTYTYNIYENIEDAPKVPMPILKDEYFHSVIIPFIAMEILARDEEFTTVYSKYQEDFEKGMFNLFNKEFNYIEDRFKRNRIEGVFFPAGNQGKNINKRKPGVFKAHDNYKPRGALYKPVGKQGGK